MSGGYLLKITGLVFVSITFGISLIAMKKYGLEALPLLIATIAIGGGAVYIGDYDKIDKWFVQAKQKIRGKLR